MFLDSTSHGSTTSAISYDLELQKMMGKNRPGHSGGAKRGSRAFRPAGDALEERRLLSHSHPARTLPAPVTYDLKGSTLFEQQLPASPQVALTGASMYAMTGKYVYALTGTTLLDAQVGKANWKPVQQGVTSFAVTSNKVYALQGTRLLQSQPGTAKWKVAAQRVSSIAIPGSYVNLPDRPPVPPPPPPPPPPAPGLSNPILGPVAVKIAHPGNVGVGSALGPAVPAALAQSGYDATVVRHAYGFDSVRLPNGNSATGAGQTIAIVDAYNDPNVFSDLQVFDKQFNLPDPSFATLDENGGHNLPGSPPPPSGGQGSWATETVMDVELAHLIAPGAAILLVEARSSNTQDLYTAVTTAAKQPGVSAVSMSWGSPEAAGEAQFDSDLTTPANHNGVTFVAASGDNGAVQYPAASPNVLGVGGTTLTLVNSAYSSETAWMQSAGSNTWSSGGGTSQFEARPSYQNGVGTGPNRTVPDVALDAATSSGPSIYDSFVEQGWAAGDGTSAAAPMWAGFLALINQGRAVQGLGSLDGRSQTLPTIYQVAAADFHDITTGANQDHISAGPGYDQVTGRGTPNAQQLANAFFGTQGNVSPAPGDAKVVASAPLSDGRLEVWEVGQDGTLYTSWQTSTNSNAGWTAWSVFATPGPAASVAVAPLSDGRLQLWEVGQNGSLYTAWKTTTDSNAPWTGWTSMAAPGPVRSVAVAPLPDGRLQLWEVGQNGSIASSWKATTDPNAGWTPWTAFNAPVGATSVAVAPLSDGRLQLWAVGQDGALYSSWKATTDPNAGWTPWTTIPTAGPAASVAVAPLSDGRLQLWEVGQNGSLYTAWKTSTDSNSAWSLWTTMATPGPVATVAAAPLSDGRLELWDVGQDGSIASVQKTSTDSNAPWNAWTGFHPG
jgi:hypothetical protein